MKKRLRKKLRLGEFREYGVEIDAELDHEPTEKEQDAFLDALVDGGMRCGGALGRHLEISVQRCICGNLFQGGKHGRKCRGTMNEKHVRSALALVEAHFGKLLRLEWKLFDLWHCDGVYGKKW